MYVNNLLSCLSAKVGEIEELEEEKKKVRMIFVFVFVFVLFPHFSYFSFKIIAERYRGQQQARDESFEVILFSPFIAFFPFLPFLLFSFFSSRI